MKRTLAVLALLFLLPLSWQHVSEPLAVRADAKTARIVASVSGLNLSAGVPATALFTASNTGLYRATAYVSRPDLQFLTLTTCVSIGFNWTNDSGVAIGSGFSPGNGDGVTSVIGVQTGTAVTYNVNAASCSPVPPAFTYNYFVTVEEL